MSFADDTTLFLLHYDVHQLFYNVNMQINNILMVSRKKRSLNLNKVKFIVIRPNNRYYDLA